MEKASEKVVLIPKRMLQFMQDVLDMRAAQNEYFNGNKTVTHFKRVKAIERKVDDFNNNAIKSGMVKSRSAVSTGQLSML